MTVFDDGEAVAGVVWIFFIALATANFAVMCTLFYRRRHLQPISARRFPWAFGSLVGWWLYMYHPAQRYLWDQQPCAMFLATGLTFQATLYCYAVRAWVLWFKYNLTVQKEKRSERLFERSNSASNMFSQEWFIENTKYASDAFLCKMFLVVTLVHATVVLNTLAYIPGLATEKWSDTPYTLSCAAFGTDIFGAWVWVSSGLSFLYMLMVVFVAFKFRKVKDGFYLKEELLFVGGFTIFSTALWNMLGFIPNPPAGPGVYPWRTFARSLWSDVSALVRACVSGWYPIYKSYYMKQGTEPPRSLADAAGSIDVTEFSEAELRQFETLQAVLASRSGRLAFRDHLKLEFSLENLMFWEAVEKFRVEYDASQAVANLELARRIVDEFALPDAALQVNIAWPTAQRLFEKVGVEFDYDDGILTNKRYRNAQAHSAAAGAVSPSAPGATSPATSAATDVASPPSKGAASPPTSAAGAPKAAAVANATTSPTSATSDASLLSAATAAGRPHFSTGSGHRGLPPAPAAGSAHHALELALGIERRLFDDAQQKVVSLMASDSFVRFKNLRRRNSVSVQLAKAEAAPRRQNGARLGPLEEDTLATDDVRKVAGSGDFAVRISTSQEIERTRSDHDHEQSHSSSESSERLSSLSGF